MGWYEALKDAVAAADQLRNAELKQKLAAVQVECAKLAEDNARLRQDTIALKEQIALQQDMRFEHNVYWRGPAPSKDGPYCPKCLIGSGKAARLADRADDHWWRCAVCHTIVEKPGSDPSEPRHAVVDDDPFPR